MLGAVELNHTELIWQLKAGKQISPLLNKNIVPSVVIARPASELRYVHGSLHLTLLHWEECSV